jgi:membrane-associated phospholipid phosphatase
VELIKFIQSFSSPFLDRLFQLITFLGEESIYVIILGFIFWCKDKKYGYKLAYLLLFSSLINGFVKDVIKAERPISIKELRHLRVETATGYSFPSGHTQNITSFVTALSLKLKNIYMYIGGSILVILVAISRLYLGLHWPKDVAFGIVFGILSIIIANYFYDFIQRSKNKYLLLLVPLPIIFIIFIFNGSEDFYKAAGIFCSFQVGYIIEDKYIKFTTKAESLKQVIKLLIGIAGALLLKVGLKGVLPIALLSDFIRYFAIGIWITVICPWLFTHIKLAGSEK